MRRMPLAARTAVLGATLALGFVPGALAAPSHADQAFATMAAQAGLAEQQAGQMAQQSAEMPQLRRYGQTLANNYGQYNDQLQQIAQQQNLNLPSAPTVYQHAQSQQLLGMNDGAFDHAFLRQQVQSQGAMLVRFQQEARSGHDPVLRKFAHDTLPMLRQQLMAAQTLLRQAPGQEGGWRGED